MKMDSLKKLQNSMLAQEIDVQKFDIKTGAAKFVCMFSAREAPMSLSLTTPGSTPQFFLFRVNDAYEISDSIENELYLKLCNVLRTHGTSGNTLVPKEFLQQIDAQIPDVASKGKIPTPETVLTLRHDLEEREKPYFDTWINWGGEKSPTPENLNKTRVMLGKEAYQHAKKNGLSSKWSATETGRTWRG